MKTREQIGRDLRVRRERLNINQADMCELVFPDHKASRDSLSMKIANVEKGQTKSYDDYMLYENALAELEPIGVTDNGKAEISISDVQELNEVIGTLHKKFSALIDANTIKHMVVNETEIAPFVAMMSKVAEMSKTARIEDIVCDLKIVAVKNGVITMYSSHDEHELAEKNVAIQVGACFSLLFGNKYEVEIITGKYNFEYKERG